MFEDTPAFSGFSVDDLEKAEAFYRDSLGVRIEEQPGMGFYLMLAGTQRVFVYPKPNHEPATFTILNFVVADITAAVTQLAAKGIAMEVYEGMEQDEHGILHGKALGRGPDIAWFKDPAGNTLSVLEEA